MPKKGFKTTYDIVDIWVVEIVTTTLLYQGLDITRYLLLVFLDYLNLGKDFEVTTFRLKC